jgi:ABC-2 type transport system permease protein
MSRTAEPRVVRSRRSLVDRVADIWRYRELLVGLVRKELKVKYKNSSLGFMWSLVNPLLYLVVYTIAFQVILRAGIPSFPIFLLSGLLVWNLFSVGLASGTSSVVVNSGLVKKVWFPREILVLASVGAALVHFFLQTSVLFVVLAIIRYDVAFAYFWLLPIALVVIVFFTSALAVLLAAANVYLRDTQHFLELALLAWFWVTPVVYSFTLVADRKKWMVVLYMLNPVVAPVLTFQRAIYAKTDVVAEGNRFDIQHVLPTWGMGAYLAYLLAVAAASVVLMLIALTVFGRLESNFAEEL